LRCKMLMRNPPHPGEILKELCLKPLGLTVTEAAKALGVSRKTLSVILNGRAGISPEMAIRLSVAFDTTAESWLNQQVQYDLWQAEQRRGELRVKRLSAAYVERALGTVITYGREH
jgi:addiction module HigA family antidote